MPSVIDELIVQLKLDPTQFTKGQKEAAEAFVRGRDSMQRGAKQVEGAAGETAQAFRAVANRALAIAAIFTGGVGMKKFAEQVTATTASLGRLAPQLDMSTQGLQQWINVGSRVGATAQDMAGSLQTVTSTLQSAYIRGDYGAPLFDQLRSMGINWLDAAKNVRSAEDILMDVARWAKGRDKSSVAEDLRQMGLGQGMINAILEGPDKLQKMLKEAAKYVPTDEEIKKLTELQEKWAELTNMASQLAITLVSEFEPVLVAILDLVERFLAYTSNVTGAGDKQKDRADVSKTPEERAKADAKAGAGMLKDAYTGWPEEGKPGLWQRFKNMFTGGGGGGDGSTKKPLAPAYPKMEVPGAPSYQSKGATLGALDAAAKATGMNPATLKAFGSIESSLDPNANANKRTQYKGLLQLNKSEFGQYGGGNIYNAKDNALAGARLLAARSAEFKSKYGRAPNDAELYMLHQQGPGFFSKGTMTNIGGNPYPGMRGPQTPQSFMEGWGREVERRKRGFEGQSGPSVHEAPSPWTGGAPAVPWTSLSHQSILSLPRRSISSTINSNSSKVTVGEVTMHTGSKDAYGLRRELPPFLEDNQFMNQGNASMA